MIGEGERPREPRFLTVFNASALPLTSFARFASVLETDLQGLISQNWLFVGIFSFFVKSVATKIYEIS